MGLIAKLFRKKENKFDHIISLGYNCEVTFRFLKYFKFEESNLFNWTYSYSVSDLIYTLNHFDSIGSEGFRYPDPLWECEKTHIRFHGKADMKLYMDGNKPPEEIVNADKNELVERIAYLKNKFLKVLRDDSSKLYIYKIRDEELSQQNIQDLEQALKNLGGNNFKLLLVCQKTANVSVIADTKQEIRFVTMFADDNHVTSRRYFRNGWNTIYDEFYCDKPRNYSKNKSYKFENKTAED